MNELLLIEARREITQKSRSQIEEETAFKWAARAVAAYLQSRSVTDPRWLRDAQTYGDEALEHAALADESGEVLRDTRTWMGRYIPIGVL